MIDESWRQGVQFEVAHAVGADHHGCILFVEGVDDLLQRLRRRVEVIGVELHGKASAAVVVDSLVPAAADTQVCALGDDMHEALVMEATQQLGGVICGVVVDHDDIVFEARFLTEC